MPKYWGKQNFSLGSFQEVGQKQKIAKVNDYNGQYLSPKPILSKLKDELGDTLMGMTSISILNLCQTSKGKFGGGQYVMVNICLN